MNFITELHNSLMNYNSLDVDFPSICPYSKESTGSNSGSSGSQLWIDRKRSSRNHSCVAQFHVSFQFNSSVHTLMFDFVSAATRSVVLEMFWGLEFSLTKMEPVLLDNSFVE